jgi:hypothetical protein
VYSGGVSVPDAGMVEARKEVSAGEEGRRSGSEQ